jgi:hypothetical protein
MLKRSHEDWLCELERYLRAATLGITNIVCPPPPADATLSMQLLCASAKALVEQNAACRQAWRAREEEEADIPF